MAGFDSIIGHDVALRLLGTFLARDSLAHALLFCGRQGVGKATIARLLAMALNCEEKNFASDKSRQVKGLFPDHLPCRKCPTCRSIAAGNHPDVIIIDSGGKPIKIEQVRDLIGALCLKPFGTGKKVAVIDSAQLMTPEAGNALLKILEEPPRETVIILTATGARELLPTIVSRCQQIRFSGIDCKILAAWLVRKVPGLDPGQASVVAAMADGRPAKALELAERGIEDRDRCIAPTACLPRSGTTGSMLAQALAWAAETASSPDTVADKLAILELWVRDLVVAAIDPDLVINSDRQEDLIKMAGMENTAHWLDCFDSILTVRRQLEAHANRRLALEVLAMQLAGIETYGDTT